MHKHKYYTQINKLWKKNQNPTIPLQVFLFIYFIFYLNRTLNILNLYSFKILNNLTIVFTCDIKYSGFHFFRNFE